MLLKDKMPAKFKFLLFGHSKMPVKVEAIVVVRCSPVVISVSLSQKDVLQTASDSCCFVSERKW